MPVYEHLRPSSLLNDVGNLSSF